MSRLGEKIFLLPSFTRQLKSILFRSARISIPNLMFEDTDDSNMEEVDWNNMLSCASILTQSKKLEHLDAALRIAQQCILNGNISEPQKLAAVVLLEGLTNKLAIKLALNRQLISPSYLQEMPLLIRLEIISRNIDHSIIKDDGSLSYLNKFQKAVYDSYYNTDAISISAPTSAGKSYILERIILEELLSQKRKNVIFIVPTRALISQVEQEISDLLIENKISNVFISTVPQAPDDDAIGKHTVFVFTQERLHWFRSELPLFKIDLIMENPLKLTT